MDGEGINDYMRARKNATAGTPGDKGRMERCKKMLIALFQKVKSENMIGQIPSLLSAVNEGMYTNLSIQQILALGNLATGINVDRIGAYALDGKVNIVLDWTFYFIDQEYRIDLIRQLYGVVVPELELVSRQYAEWLGKTGFTSVRYLTTAYEVLEYADSYSKSHYMSEEKRTAYNELKSLYQQTQMAYDTAAHSLLNEDTRTMETKRRELRRKTKDFAESIDYSEPLSWTVNPAWNEDPCINEVNVNFH